MSPTRASDLLRCTRPRRARHRPARSGWGVSAPRIRDDRLRPSEPVWPVCEFAEADYCYGIGPIRLRVLSADLSTPIPHDGDTWFGVRGVVVDRAGRAGEVREMLIRAGRLPVPPACKRPRLRVLRSTPV
ncbi:hypothetical protein [Actinoplanes missouriensis]|uniref:hypothetical protein n=1 Tax=Actinoplanes missouriensis TaxID=1866 RepID=UPI001E3A7094|nr:hypothetical protein [Actinoplanes missouriensis]